MVGLCGSRAAGKIGGSLELDGVGDYVATPSILDQKETGDQDKQ